MDHLGIVWGACFVAPQARIKKRDVRSNVSGGVFAKQIAARHAWRIADSHASRRDVKRLWCGVFAKQIAARHVRRRRARIPRLRMPRSRAVAGA